MLNYSAKSTNCFSNFSSDLIIFKASPWTTIPTFLKLVQSSLTWLSVSWMSYLSAFLIVLYSVFPSINPAAIPILIAVSTLSPVSTQTLMPAAFKNWIVKSTSSYNLSSIAVDPNNSISFSIILWAWSSKASLSSRSSFAFSTALCHYSYSLSFNTFWARYKVLRPWVA